MVRKLLHKGFSVVEALAIFIVVGSIALGGWYIWQKHHTAKSLQQNSLKTQTGGEGGVYAHWKTFNLENGFSFKYPANWTVVPNSDSASVEIDSPIKNNYYFTFQAAIGSANTNLNLNFLGTASGNTIVKLDSPGSMSPLYLVAQTNADTNITGLGLATTPGGPSTSFGILDNGGRGTQNVVIAANLITAGSRSSVNNPYSMQTYEEQPDYLTVVNIFKSLSR
jgi:hypothetical protein